MELKPCPFCGGTAEIEDEWELACKSCFVAMSADDIDNLIDLWNYRTGDWYPVTQRLPKPGVDVLAWMPSLAHPVYGHCSPGGYWRGVTYAGIIDMTITHWQPLPAAPGGDA